MLEEGRPGNATVGDVHCLGTRAAGKLSGVLVPASPGREIVIEQNDSVLRTDVGPASPAGDRVQAVALGV
jgi:hypothetical protein